MSETRSCMFLKKNKKMACVISDIFNVLVPPVNCKVQTQMFLFKNNMLLIHIYKKHILFKKTLQKFPSMWIHVA